MLAGSQAQQADSAPRPEVALTLNHYDPFGSPVDKTPAHNQLHSIAKRFIPFSPLNGPDPRPGLPSPPVEHTPLAHALPSEAGFSKRRPRHVPIVIPPNVIGSVLKHNPTLQEPITPYPQTITRTGPRLTYDFQKEEPLVTKRYQRPRHIPIVIPAFAEPQGLFPPTPPNSANNTPRASVQKPHSCEQFFTDMSRPTTSGSRTSTIDSNASGPSPNQMDAGRFKPSSSTYLADMNSSSESSLNQDQMAQPQVAQPAADSALLRPPQAADATPQSTAPPPAVNHSPPQTNSTTNLSGLVCNVHKCTGKEPRALVGATTTVLGDKLYVFGGRVLSRRHPQLTSDLYELDLVRRHWTKVETSGDIPPPRYFHSMCALGDTKLICYGGMSPANPVSSQAQANGIDLQPEMIVMSDIHVFDAPTRRWTSIATANTPQGRYAHCAAVLPSSATFASANAPLSAIHHNPPSATPNQGSLGVALDGTGGAEMVVVGGQDSANTYIEQISVFNLRSLKWTATSSLGRSCGAYRSVVAPLTSIPASKIGKGLDQGVEVDGAARKSDRAESDSSMLIYSNYNFLDVKLELQVRLADGSLVEKPMSGQFSPPGLRFPNGGVLDNHFVVSGTYLTSSKQEYALWALDLKTLTWSRIDAGGGVFSQGSWNRGVLWPRRNTFVILGNRKRSLVEDYNHRRINFSHLCMVELEAFGLYDNPRRAWPTSNFPSISAPVLPPSVVLKNVAPAGRPLPGAAVDLGLMAMNLRDLADMDLIAIGQERIPVNSYLLAHRWGPFFVHLLRESSGTTSSSSQNDASSSSDGGTLRPSNLNPASVTSRNSSVTITPSVTTAASAAPSSLTANSNSSTNNRSLDPPKPEALPPCSRPRQLYLPHTLLTLRSLVHYLYTSTLPGPNHPLCTPQILCSLLQLARPYRVEGLLEATVERLHQILDGRNAAAVFNAAAMAAGGGRGTGAAFSKEGEAENEEIAQGGLTITRLRGSHRARTRSNDQSESEDTGSEISRSEISSSAASESESDVGGNTHGRRVAVGAEEVWAGGISCVVGLQKRGLRGLMEGRRARERGQTVGKGGVLGINGAVNGNDVGLGIV
ncbi:hypothetical protein HO133_008485 [Letharia lupina]|uniref:Uncharacterized protein n=1 Tax=Letharia lupina TaxID=560253 RepID=A0A8H6FGJ4_9LECA|nr:uncharacterized protein HO133_008485 [Letharia lupina]KAF6227044.1 hypothetical protein HO133_008485 [Letharia lupina]